MCHVVAVATGAMFSVFATTGDMCFVVAAAQCGTHADGRRTYGHAVIISPWGKVMAEVPTDDDDAEAGANDGIALATLDHGMVAKARDAIPSLTTNPGFSRDG